MNDPRGNKNNESNNSNNKLAPFQHDKAMAPTSRPTRDDHDAAQLGRVLHQLPEIVSHLLLRDNVSRSIVTRNVTSPTRLRRSIPTPPGSSLGLPRTTPNHTRSPSVSSPSLQSPRVHRNSWHMSLAHSVFVQYDRDRDGYLSPNGAQKAADRLGCHVVLDKDDDMVDFDAFWELLQQHDMDTSTRPEEDNATRPEESSSSPRRLLYTRASSDDEHNEQQAHNDGATEGTSRWLLDPAGAWHFAWEIQVSLTIVTLLFTFPLQVGWDELSRKFSLVNVIIDAVFFLDVPKNFLTDVVNDDDGVTMDYKTARTRYQRGWFAFDLLAALPMTCLFLMFGHQLPSAAYLSSLALKLLKVPRLFQLFRLRHINRLYRKFMWATEPWERHVALRVTNAMVKIFLFLFFTVILGHWIGCIQFYVARLHDFPAESWVVMSGLTEKSIYDQWIWSFFKALAQMVLIGFETPPFTNATCNTMTHWCQIEHWSTLCGLYLGAFFFSFLVAAFHSIIETYNIPHRNFDEHLRNLDGFLRYEGMSTDDRRHIKEDFIRRHRKGQYFSESQVLADLAPNRQEMILLHRVKILTETHSLFHDAENQDLLRALSLVLHRTVYHPKEAIFVKSDHGKRLYFLVQGTAVSLGLAGTLASGDTFGFEPEFVNGERFLSVRAASKCVLLEASLQDWTNIMEAFPDVYAEFKAKSLKRWRASHGSNYQSVRTNDNHPSV